MDVQGVVVLLLLLKPLHTGTNKGRIIKTPRYTHMKIHLLPLVLSLRSNHPIACSGKPNPSKRQEPLRRLYYACTRCLQIRDASMVYCSVITDRLYYSHQLTVSLSLFLPAILEMDSPTLLTSLMKPAPLMAAVSLALGSYQGR